MGIPEEKLLERVWYASHEQRKGYRAKSNHVLCWGSDVGFPKAPGMSGKVAEVKAVHSRPESQLWDFPTGDP